MRCGCRNRIEVHIAKAEHVFSAAHFITFANHCERLHGHNYHVAAEIDRAARRESPRHRFSARPCASFSKSRPSWITTCCFPRSIRKFVLRKMAGKLRPRSPNGAGCFPAGDCRLLPVPNTTSELLAAYIGKRLFDALGGAAARIERMNVSVDECDGQIGVWRGRR